ncbi:AraC family transcriptional regulator [Gemmiger formicilis]|nr:AraC family transcriptional regulator [Gemmiger formicilis]
MKTKQLSIEALQSARQTLLQIVYVELAKADCKAPDLFNNAVAQELSEKSVQSMMDFIRWANYLLSTAFSKLELTARQETISQKVHRYIKEHYAENIDRNSIAEEFYVNPEYLGKIYKRERKKSEGCRFRVSDSESPELLSHPNIRIGEIAMEVGFDSFAYFSTLFKKYTGTTPNEYRKISMSKRKRIEKYDHPSI